MTDDADSTTTDEQHEDTVPESVRDGLRDATTPLATTDPEADADADALATVCDRLADAAVVGLGEATHGTREFFELKHRIVRRLVVDEGVRAVALETGLPETMALHDYVVHGEGDPREALAGAGVECWTVRPVLSMVEWLRGFNAGRPPDDRVAIYGVGATHTSGAVRRLREHFEAVDPDVLDDLGADLALVDDDHDSPPVDDVTEWVAAAERVVSTLRAHLTDRRPRHLAATSERARTLALRYVTVIERALRKVDALGCFEREAPAEYGRSEYLRTIRTAGFPGRTMADNVAWVRDRADADTLVVWAHDAHLNRTAFSFPTGTATAPNLGAHLAERHGEDYYALGFSFGRGSFQAVSRADGEAGLREHRLDGPLPGTVDAVLDGLDEPLAVVDLRVARDDDRTADWLSEPRRGFRTGWSYDPDAPEDHLAEYIYGDAFDGLCFVAETTRARPLEAGDDSS